LGAARRGQRAPGGAGQILMLPPPGRDHVGQVDVQQLGGGRADLADRGVPGQRGDPVQNAAQVGTEVGGPQALGNRGRGVLAGAEQHGQRGVWVGGARVSGCGRAHGADSSIVVTAAAGCGSMRMLCVASVRLGWTVTAPGGPACGTVLTAGGGGDGGRGRRRLRKRAAARPAAQTAASRMNHTVAGIWNGDGPVIATEGGSVSAVSTAAVDVRCDAPKTELPAACGAAAGW